jgi:hypothetical protein
MENASVAFIYQPDAPRSQLQCLAGNHCNGLNPDPDTDDTRVSFGTVNKPQDALRPLQTTCESCSVSGLVFSGVIVAAFFKLEVHCIN